MNDLFSFSPFVVASAILLVVALGLVVKLRLLKKQLEAASIRDHVTNAIEWPYNEEEAQRLVKHCERHKQCICFQMIHLDRFQALFNEQGPTMGQEAMIFVAKVIAKIVRESDLFGVYSNGKFILCLPGTDINGAVVLAERIRQAVSQSDQAKISVSIGCAERQSGESSVNVIKRANGALERAKVSGGNRVAASKNHEAKTHENSVWPNLRNLR